MKRSPHPLMRSKAGDQLRARGEKNADGTEIAAAEVVSGSFRNISGTISAIDPGASTFTVKDLITQEVCHGQGCRRGSDAPFAGHDGKNDRGAVKGRRSWGRGAARASAET